MRKKIFLTMILIISILFFCTGCAKLPVPEVTKGSFDFSVTYEVDGTEKTYAGVYVCEYEGIYVTFVGKGRRWSGYVENLDHCILTVKEKGNVVIHIDFDLNPKYFMADPDYYDEKPTPIVYGEEINHETGETFIFSDAEEIYTNYGVRIVSYNYSDPIENNYKDKFTFGKFEPSIN